MEGVYSLDRPKACDAAIEAISEWATKSDLLLAGIGSRISFGFWDLLKSIHCWALRAGQLLPEPSQARVIRRMKLRDAVIETLPLNL